jgi:hypothetical protein
MSARACPPSLSQASEASQLHTMKQAFHASGGIATSEALVASLARFTSQPIARLARWIADGEVLRFPWQGAMMLPLFQFDRTRMAPDPSVTLVIRELAPVLEDWDACLWFAQPNASLKDALPVDVLREDARAVLQAARAHAASRMI